MGMSLNHRHRNKPGGGSGLGSAMGSATKSPTLPLPTVGNYKENYSCDQIISNDNLGTMSELSSAQEIGKCQQNIMHPSGLKHCIETISCWLAAENALHHVRCNSAKIATIFSHWQIPESDYARDCQG